MLTIMLMSVTCIVLLLTLKSSELSGNICLAFCLLVLLLLDISRLILSCLFDMMVHVPLAHRS